MKRHSDVGFAAFAGIDWSDTKHDSCWQAVHSEEREWAVVPHRPAAIDAWASALRQRFGGRPVAVCLELAKDRWFMRCRSTTSWLRSKA